MVSLVKDGNRRARAAPSLALSLFCAASSDDALYTPSSVVPNLAKSVATYDEGHGVSKGMRMMYEDESEDTVA